MNNNINYIGSDIILTSVFILFLQGLRDASGGLFDQFFMTCTGFGNIHIILFLIGVLYWCYDKKLGEYLLVSMAVARIFNSFTKLTACVYRPWVTDPNIKPFEEALPDATGYSLPSGHATSSGILFLGTYLKGNVTKGLKIFAIICLLLICFSRCYLGVHSLMDIVVGLIIVLISLFIGSKIMDKLENNPKFDLIVLGAGFVLCIVLITYATFKSYPMDYDSAGKLIVDPAKMALEAYKDSGFCLGILISWVIERRFIKFSSEGPLDRRILRVGGAYLGYLVLMNILYPLIKTSLPPQIANFLAFFMFPLYVVLIVPAIIKFFQNRHEDVYGDLHEQS